MLLEWGCEHGLAQVGQTSDENQKGLKLIFVDVHLMKRRSGCNGTNSNHNLFFSNRF